MHLFWFVIHIFRYHCDTEKVQFLFEIILSSSISSGGSCGQIWVKSCCIDQLKTKYTHIAKYVWIISKMPMF